MKTLNQIAAELQGYDPQALSAAGVNDFLHHLVAPVTQTESVQLIGSGLWRVFYLKESQTCEIWRVGL